MKPWIALCAAGAGLGVLVAACGGEDKPAAPDVLVLPTVTDAPTSPLPSPTVITRREPSPTPTPEPDPLEPVASRVLADIPVPYGATLVTFSLGRVSADALADYALADADSTVLRDWFAEHMRAYGWDEPTPKDGALVFLHESQRPLRAPDDEDARRTTTIIFERKEGVAFTILSEEALK